MVGLLSRHLSKTSTVLTSLPLSELSQSPPPQRPPLYPAPQESPHLLLVGPLRTLTSPTKGRRRENGAQLQRWQTGEVVTADHSHSHHPGITATSQTAIQTKWRLMCRLWMGRLWIQTTHLWKIHLLLFCLENHLSPAPKLRLPPRLDGIIQKRNLAHRRKLASQNPPLPTEPKANASPH